MTKRIWALLTAAVLLLALGACGRQKKDPDTAGTVASPGDANTVAETFVRALRTRDNLTCYSLLLYDARSAWEESAVKNHGSEQAFFDEVKRQAEEKGIELTSDIDSFESYYAAYHQFILEDYRQIYGEHTFSTKVVESVKLTEDEVATFRENLLNSLSKSLFDEEVLAQITEVYTVTVNFSVDGELKDFSEDYPTSVVYYNGQWLIASYSE